MFEVWAKHWTLQVFCTRISGPAYFDPFGVKIERLYFVTFPNYTHWPL